MGWTKPRVGSFAHGLGGSGGSAPVTSADRHTHNPPDWTKLKGGWTTEINRRQVRLSRQWKEIQKQQPKAAEKETARQTKQQREGHWCQCKGEWRVQVHLSRLWTDTQVQENNQNRERRSEAGNRQGKKRKRTSAPVTSMDRHTCTEEKNRRVNQRKRN